MQPTIRTLAAIAAVAAIALLDMVVSSRLPFSILYFAPVIAASWYGNRSHGLAVAIAATTARLLTDIHWNGMDQLSLATALLWGCALVMTPRLTAWAHARRGEVAALESRVNELVQIERSFARTDPLTSLCNRRAFIDALQKAEARGRRTGERLAVARLDVDGFKALNDTYSRNEGDQLLRAVSTSLSLTTRMGDLAARLENDEFSLLLYNCGPDNAMKIGQRLVDEVAELGRAYPDARVTASVGMACFATSGPDPDEMMRLAGSALRHARQNGGNAVIIETPDAAPREAVASSEPPASR
jgi:diguanylate cyclase (GGDEF)-like protein